MYPKLKDYVFFTPLDDGNVFFRSQTGNVVFRGKDSYRWIERLAPLLDGQRTIDEICRGLDQEREARVRLLIGQLVDNGLVRDSAQDAASGITAEEARLYAAALAHLENHSSQPYQLLETIREAHVFMAGSGSAYQSTLKGLLEMGVRHLALWSRDSAVESILQSYHERDTTIEWKLIQTKACPVIPPEYKTVVYAGAHYGDPSALQLLKQCQATDKTFLCGGFFNELLYVGPLVRPGEPGCPACALYRLGASLERSSQNLDRRSSVYTGVLGYYLAYQTFCHLAGILTQEQEKELISFDLDTVTLQRHRLYPRPECFYCHPKQQQRTQQTDLIKRFAMKLQAPSQESFEEAILPLIDQQVGILGRVLEEDSEHLPLHQVRVTVYDQFGTYHHREHDLLILGPDLKQARYCALRAGLAAYARGISKEPQEHWWNERGQLSTQPSQRTTAFATGLTYWEWIGTGLLEITRHYAWTRADQVELSTRWTGNGSLPRQVIVAIKMLRIRFNIPIEAHLLRLPEQFPGSAIALYSRGQLAEICVDIEPVRALERGLLCLLQHAYQQEHHPEISALTLLAALQHDLTHDVFFQEIDWAAWTPAACEQSRHHGFAVLLHPEIPDPVLGAVGLLTGYVGLVPSEAHVSSGTPASYEMLHTLSPK